MNLESVNEMLMEMGMHLLEGEYVVKNHTPEELSMVELKEGASGILSRLIKNDKEDAPVDNLSYDKLIEKMNPENNGKSKFDVIVSDFIKIGDTPVNVALQKAVISTFPYLGVPCKKEAAHLSINVTRSTDGGEFAIVDKDLIKNPVRLFTHEPSEVFEESIIQKVPEGQMEATTLVTDPHFDEFDILDKAIADLSSIMSIEAANRIKGTGDDLKRKLLNMAYMLNKGGIRNQIDNRILASLPDDVAKDSTKADRYDQVTRYMSVVNDKLGTYATTSHVVCMELQQWEYSIFEINTSTLSKAKGRKYFKLTEDLGLKVDMKGSRSGGKYPITPDQIPNFKKNAGQIQRLYLTVMENQVRADLAMDRLPLPEIDLIGANLLEDKSDEKIIAYIIKRNNSDLVASEILEEAKKNVKLAIEEAFKEALQAKVADSL